MYLFFNWFIYMHVQIIFTLGGFMKKKDKVEKVMKEFKEGKLHSGSKKGPKVGSRKQAIAIAISEAKKREKINI